MEAYRRTVKRRRMLQAALTLVALALVLAVWLLTGRGVQAPGAGFLEGFTAGGSLGLMVAFLLLSAAQVIAYSRALKNDEALRLFRIREEDEREKMIRDRIGGFGFNFTLGLVLVATVVFTWINTVAALTLFCTLAAMALIKAGLKLYYKKKF